MTKTSIKPLFDRVLLRRLESRQNSQSTIILPDTAQEKSQEGEVIATGDKAEHVSAGDHVLFGKYSGVEINFDGEDVVLLREEEILAVVE